MLEMTRQDDFHLYAMNVRQQIMDARKQRRYTMDIEYTSDGYRKITKDDGMAYCEYRCFQCGEWLNQDDVVWANNSGKLTTGEHGKAWCVECLPQEEEV